MKKIDRQNLSADMRRIAWWLQTGREGLAKKFIDLGKVKYGGSDSVVGGREMKWWWKELGQDDRKKAAERALTLSLLLK